MPETALPPLPDLPAPPPALLTGAALFLDFDGTLAPIADTPDGVHVDDDLLALLAALRRKLDGRLAIVSGRSIATLRDFGFQNFLLAGTHGLEFAAPGAAPDAPPRLPAIDAVERAFHIFADTRPGVLVERKSISVGLHFRGAPDCGEAAGLLAHQLAEEHGLAVQAGKMLFETPEWQYGLRAQYELADFVFGLQGKYVGERFANDGATAMADMHRAGRVGRDILDIDLLAAARLAVTIGLPCG